MFLTAAVINYHKLSGSKQHYLLSYSSGRQRSENGSYWAKVKVSVSGLASGTSR